jgi:hypothetical protein
MHGYPACSRGFNKIEPILRQARLLRRGVISDLDSCLMRQREVVSMAIAILKGSNEALLCDDPDCAACASARRFTCAPEPLVLPDSPSQI